LNKNLNNSEILKNIFKDRQKYYEKADLIINNNGDRSKVDIRNEKIGYKIREATHGRVP